MKERSLSKRSVERRFFDKYSWLVLVPPVAFVTVLLLGYWVLDWHSFWVTNVASLVGVCLILLLRPDLLYEAFIGGISLVLVVLPVFWILIWSYPGIIQRFWFLPKLSGVLVTGIPLEDILFYFFAGAFLAPLYEFLFKKRLVKIPD